MKTHTGRFLHPVQPHDGTKRFLYFSGDKARLAFYKGYLDTLRRELELGVRSIEDVEELLAKAEARRKPVPVSQLFALYLEADRVSANTRRIVRAWLKVSGQSIAELDARSLTQKTIVAWLDRLEKKKAARSTIVLAWRVLSMVVRSAVERGVLERCPWDSWRPTFRGGAPRKVDEAARTVGELEALLSAAHTLDADRVPWRASLQTRIACAALLGLGQGELAGLRWTDLDPGAGTITIARQYDGRKVKALARAGTLRALPELFELLETHRLELVAEALYAPDGPVFPNPMVSRAGTLRPYRMRASGHAQAVIDAREVRRAVELAGLPHPERWTVRSLRISFITLEAQHHVDLASLAARSRHSGVSSLVRYLRSRTREPAEPGFRLAPAPLRALSGGQK